MPRHQQGVGGKFRLCSTTEWPPCWLAGLAVAREDAWHCTLNKGTGNLRKFKMWNWLRDWKVKETKKGIKTGK